MLDLGSLKNFASKRRQGRARQYAVTREVEREKNPKYRISQGDLLLIKEKRRREKKSSKLFPAELAVLAHIEQRQRGLKNFGSALKGGGHWAKIG